MEVEIKKDIMAMESGLADCAATAKAVITRGGRNRDRLKGFLQERVCHLKQDEAGTSFSR